MQSLALHDDDSSLAYGMTHLSRDMLVPGAAQSCQIVAIQYAKVRRKQVVDRPKEQKQEAKLAWKAKPRCQEGAMFAILDHFLFNEP